MIPRAGASTVETLGNGEKERSDATTKHEGEGKEANKKKRKKKKSGKEEEKERRKEGEMRRLALQNDGALGEVDFSAVDTDRIPTEIDGEDQEDEEMVKEEEWKTPKKRKKNKSGGEKRKKSKGV